MGNMARYRRCRVWSCTVCTCLAGRRGEGGGGGCLFSTSLMVLKLESITPAFGNHPERFESHRYISAVLSSIAIRMYIVLHIFLSLAHVLFSNQCLAS